MHEYQVFFAFYTSNHCEYSIVQFLDPDLHGMDKFDPPIPVLIQHLDNLLEPHVVRNLLNSLHSQQHLINANHRLPATEIESCSVMTHVKTLVETAFIRSIFKIDIYIYMYACSFKNLLSQERCDQGLMSKRTETLETESYTSSPDWWQCIEEI